MKCFKVAQAYGTPDMPDIIIRTLSSELQELHTILKKSANFFRKLSFPLPQKRGRAVAHRLFSLETPHLFTDQLICESCPTVLMPEVACDDVWTPFIPPTFQRYNHSDEQRLFRAEA